VSEDARAENKVSLFMGTLKIDFAGAYSEATNTREHPMF